MDTPDEIVPFSHPEFGELRVLTINGEQWFVAKDVATALGYAKPNNALNAHCKGDALIQGITDNLGREQQARFITEGDLYRLIASSKLPSAQRFESWAFDEVLPTIHAHGGYITPAAAERIISDPGTFTLIEANF